VAAWKAASLGVGSEIILPAPETVAAAFASIARDGKFLPALGATALRGLSAFLISMALGSVVGFLTGVSKGVEQAVSPAMTVIRATPVLAVILLALIWFPSGVVPVFSAVVMAFPVVVADVSAGVRSADPRLIEMARAFRASARDTAVFVRVPSAMPHVVSAARNALGLSWKVVVAGEVLSQPARAVGSGMQSARVMLETAEVFAWAAVGVALCALSDLAFDIVRKRLAWPTK